jgi:hypothetical protein
MNIKEETAHSFFIKVAKEVDLLALETGRHI